MVLLAGVLRGLHNLDTCDPFIAPSPSETWQSVEGQAGEGVFSSVDSFPPAGASVRFLEAHVEGWRRLDCAEPPGLALAGLPQGLAVLSLQVGKYHVSIHVCSRGSKLNNSHR